MPRETCPVCDSADTEPFLHRRGVPVHQNMLFDTASAARGTARGDLEMRACAACGFVFNAAFDPAETCSRGPVFAWGAGAKGVTFCNLADPDRRRLAGAVDVNRRSRASTGPEPGTGSCRRRRCATPPRSACSTRITSPKCAR